MTLSWHLATRLQLFLIVNDKGTKHEHRLEASYELQRRNQAKRANIKYVEKR